LEVTPKKGLNDLCGREKLCRQKLHKKLFGHVWGNSGKDPSVPKNLPAATPMMKRHLRSHCSTFERTEGEMPPSCLNSLASLCILFYTRSL